MSTENQTAENDQAPVAQKKRFKKRWFVFLILLVGLGPYFYFRATSFARKIQTIDFSDAASVGATPEFSGTLRVACWNIAHGRGMTFDNWEEGHDEKSERIRQIAAEISSFDADLVVLNEVDFSATWSGGLDQANAIAQRAGYRYCLKQSNLDFGFIYGRWHFGNVLLSKYPISDAEVVEFAGVNAWEDWVVGSKRGFACTVQLAPETQVSVVGLHLESRSEAVRVKEVPDVCKVTGRLKHPILLAGDLNTTPAHAPHSSTDTDGENAFELLVKQSGLSFSPSNVPAPDEYTFSTMQPQSVIDWIMFESMHLKLIDQHVVNSQLSDHLPVVAEFKLVE